MDVCNVRYIYINVCASCEPHARVKKHRAKVIYSITLRDLAFLRTRAGARNTTRIVHVRRKDLSYVSKSRNTPD